MSDEHERETARLYRVSRTIHELVRDRGFEIGDEEITMSLNQFKGQYGAAVDKAKLNFTAALASDPSIKIYVFYADEPSVGIKTMRKFIGILEEQAIGKGIIIYKTNMTPSANKVISAMVSQFTIEAFQESELLVNITHHTLVPKHEVLSTEEKKELLLKYRLKDTQLPRIQLSDPVSRYYGLRRGQVVKITRPSETAGRYVSYRLCL
ncbi:DNA-directed RNA polymerase I, II, and III subunit RPABC1 [Microbotryum lychnidis-dioicae p1A1 Lamole]|uniref:DNA-directed RNA polymerases I, II, and III subunit RPABC1 n=1 Tax=Microbotryum lychnidis-dioicae (strain p1A1 Lamole / MvSl-1064) TaxID=683840 RepID=U5GYN8_USTV1|nr:DNA-directed RNA polymerase I, II, and III subunit RPABC1 [Microbotryum lychnidis-dioicae p1A1 Lamole]|eukprot:KDE09397.1 DNA-directed RNA polymerase I, II, and III subunit RPABC1 [Microbotryum lychnidis-dioicae p1A1 Lamole]